MTAPLNVAETFEGVVVSEATAVAPTDAAADPARLTFTLLALATLLVAAALRFWRLDMAEFKADELAVTNLAFALAQHGQWPAHGIVSSLGNYNSPFFIYVEAIPALVWASPLALTALVAALNVGAVALAIVFTRRYFGSMAALVSGILFATAPWAVVYSRKIWEQDLLPPVVLLFFIGLFAVVIDRKPRWLLLCGVTAAVAIQLHPSAIVLPAIAAPALLLWPARFPLRHLAVAGAGALLVLLPYLWSEWQSSFGDWRFALQNGQANHLGPMVGLLVALVNWLEAVSGWQVLGPFDPSGISHGDPLYVSAADALLWLLLGLAAVYLIVNCRRALAAGAHRHDRAAQARLLLTLWLLVPPLLMGLTGMLTFPHYFIVGYPAPFLAIGVVAARVSERLQGSRRGVLALVALLALLNVATLGRFLLSVDRSPFPNTYGLPLAWDGRIAAAIAADAAGRPYTLSVDPAFRDGQAVVQGVLQWTGPALGSPAPPNGVGLVYEVLPGGQPAPGGMHVLLTLGPAGHSPIVQVWASSPAARSGSRP